MSKNGLGWCSLQKALQWLNQKLAQAVSDTQEIYGSETLNDPYQGLYIHSLEIERLLSNQMGNPLLSSHSFSFEKSPETLFFFSYLQQVLSLSLWEGSIILIALAPEIDLTYEKVYAYLQNDITRKRPTLDLALNLLCSSPQEKYTAYYHFDENSPLIQQGLLELVADSSQPDASRLAYALKLDQSFLRWLLGQAELDASLSYCAELLHPQKSSANLFLAIETQQALLNFCKTQKSFQFYFYESNGSIQKPLIASLAHQLNRNLLIVNTPQLLSTQTGIETVCKRLFTSAKFHEAILYFQDFDELLMPDKTSYLHTFLKQLKHHSDITFMSGKQAWTPSLLSFPNWLIIPCCFPDTQQRQIYWQESLSQVEHQLTSLDIETLANRFQLTLEQIQQAVHLARNQSRWQRDIPAITLETLLATARSQSRQDLKDLATKIKSKYTWADIILSSDSLRQLHEVCNQAKYRSTIYEQWGFSRRFSLGKGLNVLFCGSSGTGKTLAAEVIAQDLGLDLYKIDLSQIVSKYIGETEKNLDRIFKAALMANAILFFDEADALFGKRSEVKEAHDRYANIEVSYLLQKMEEYEGIAILATNLRQNLDEAFIRRLQFIIPFPFPDEEHRLRIWQILFPPQTPLAEEVDFEILAREIDLSGGNLKNIALNAAFYAVADRGIIEMRHLWQAAEREYQKLGRTWTRNLK